MKYSKSAFRLLLIYLTSTIIVTANDINKEDIYHLLSNIEKKTDLSAKTKLENGGISFIYTRDDLERMQIKKLNDILKSAYPFGYNENRLGRADPLTFGTNAPFVSSMIRVFIDNQEITTGLYGSGIVVLGDIDLGFVDHIEIYTQNPSYEFSTEATFVLVKLYTKVAQKDEGGKVELHSDNYGTKSASGYYSQELEKWSYFNYISNTNLKREKYDSHDTKLSRDKQRTHIVSSIYTKDQRILLQAIKSKEDAFIGKSIDATPVDNTYDMDFLHVGYDTKKDGLSFLASYDYMYTDYYFTDDNGMVKTLEAKLSSHIYSSELKYDYLTDKNKLVTGIKYRIKEYSYDARVINNTSKPNPNNDTQTVGTIFLENQYSQQDNSIITTGISYSEVKNNHTTQNDNLLMYRLGHTFTNDNWIFKTIGSHVEMSLDPYLVGNENSYVAGETMDIQSMNSIIENIIYQKDNNKYEFMITNLKTKNYLVPNSQGLLYNYEKDISTNAILMKWTHNYNEYDKLFLTIKYSKKYNLPQMGDQTINEILLRNVNTYKEFDIFNEMIVYKDNTDDKEFYDYSLGVKYHYNKDLTISLKGENLLNKAKTTTYNRKDPNTLTAQTPLEISPIDRRITLFVEYLF